MNSDANNRNGSKRTTTRHTSQKTTQTRPARTRKRSASILSNSDSEDAHHPTKRTRTVNSRSKQKRYPKNKSNDEAGSSNKCEKNKNKNTKAADKSNKNKKADDSVEDKTCPICFKTFNKKEKIAIPKGCAHAFCLPCLQQWSKNTNTCPIDRKVFNSISVQKNVNNNNVVRVIPVETKKLFEDYEEELSGNESDDSIDWPVDFFSDLSDSPLFPLIDSDSSDSDSDIDTPLFVLLALRFMSY